jgi:hypothetical protein
MGNVVDIKKYKAKPKKVLGYRMSFYSEEEIEMALLALNMYGFHEIRYTRQHMKRIDPVFIKRCLLALYNTDFLSLKGRRLINNIVDNIEEIYDEKVG